MFARQDALGWDRHGRKYWFLCRRILMLVSRIIVVVYIGMEGLSLLGYRLSVAWVGVSEEEVSAVLMNQTILSDHTGADELLQPNQYSSSSVCYFMLHLLHCSMNYVFTGFFRCMNRVGAWPVPGSW